MAEEKENVKRRKKKKTSVQKLWGFLKFQMVLIVIVAVVLGYFYGGGYAETIRDLNYEAKSLVARSNRDTFRAAQTSIAYDANGETLAILKGAKDVYYVEYEQIPIYIRQAIVSIEDKRFYKHSGVDLKGIIRAAWAIIRDKEITQGGSTITQQLARTVFLSNDKTWQRKVEEIYIARALEDKYSKEDILEFYLNNVYFANGYYGIQAASQGYFGTDVSHLSLSQMIFLCAIPNSPTRYDPIDNLGNAVERRDRILRTLLDERVISRNSYEAAIAEQIQVVEPEVVKNNYAATYTYYCATRALMSLDGFEFKTVFENDEEKAKYQELYNEAYNECNSRLFTGGYRIYTSIDLGMQESLQESLDAGLSSFLEVGEDGIYEMQGSAVCIDNNTGFVKAIVGGRNQELEGYTLNRAFQSFRQPGSSIKPLVVYTPALERGYTPDSIVVDEAIEGGPANGDGVYSGRMSLSDAVARSKNTVAWKIFEELTPEVGISYLEAMNFARLDENDKRLPASIGGFTNGVSAVEMAKAFAALQNSGVYREADCITKITDANGEEIYTSDRSGKVVYQENASRMMTQMLQGVITRGTGRGYSLGNMPSAGKTGTTNDNKDGWFVGYTPYYTTAVWVGYDIPREVRGLGGGTYPGRIWHDYMLRIHEGLEPVAFVQPNENLQPEPEPESEPEQPAEQAQQQIQQQVAEPIEQAEPEEFQEPEQFDELEQPYEIFEEWQEPPEIQEDTGG